VSNLSYGTNSLDDTTTSSYGTTTLGDGAMSYGSGFNLDNVSSSLGSAMESTENQMESFMSSMDPNNMDDILQLQMYMVEWETVTETESSVYKGIGDSLKTVANNVGS
jgi:hypothetical protein